MYVINCQCRKANQAAADGRRSKSISNKRSYERTSYEVRKRWDDANLKKYGLSFHVRNDADIIEYVEAEKAKGKQTTEVFREAIAKILRG